MQVVSALSKLVGTLLKLVVVVMKVASYISCELFVISVVGILHYLCHFTKSKI